MIYTLTLNPALDYVLKVNNLSAEDINRAEEACISFGGKGINVSSVLNELGCDNTALGFAGGFTGEKLEKMLEKEGIKTDFIHIEGETRINVKIRCESEVDINAPSPEISDREIKKLFEKLDEIRGGDWLVLAGSVPRTLGDNIYERIMQNLSKKGVNFVVDAEGDLLLNSLKYKPFLVKPNHHELGALFDVEIKDAKAAAEYARKLKHMGAQNVLVSLAENGALLIDEYENEHIAKNAAGKLINSVGCGDSTVAGFIAGYIKTKDYSHSLKLATACGNAAAYSKGLAKKEKIETYFSGE